MVLKLPWAQKRMFWAFEKGIFQNFASFWVTKLKLSSAKLRQSFQNYLNKMLAIGSSLENVFEANLSSNVFEATLSSKTNVLSIWKKHFSVFCKFLSDEVETVFWENETERSEVFKLKFGYRKLLRKWFWSYLELKNECSEHLKRAFLKFLQIFEWRSWNRFLAKRDNAAKTFSIKCALSGCF